jgi:hypothetical protein
METGVESNTNAKTQLELQAVLWQLRKTHTPKRTNNLTNSSQPVGVSDTSA